MSRNVKSLSAPAQGRRGSIPLAFWFLLPVLIMVALFFLLPAIITGLLSLTDMNYTFNWNFIGFENFREIFYEDPIAKTTLINTIIYVFFTLLFFNFGLGLLLAITTTHMEERAGRFFRLIWMLPRLTPSVVYALLWLWILDPTEAGILNSILKHFGLPTYNWINMFPKTVVIIANGFIGASFGMVIFTASILSLPRDMIVAARVDGASELKVITKIILPNIKWHLLFVSAYQMLSLLTSYEYILLITDGGPFYKSEVWALYTYHTAFGDWEFGYAAALSVILSIAGFIAALLYLRTVNIRALLKKPKIEGI